jgi:hypothetical protein
MPIGKCLMPFNQFHNICGRTKKYFRHNFLQIFLLVNFSFSRQNNPQKPTFQGILRVSLYN